MTCFLLPKSKSQRRHPMCTCVCVIELYIIEKKRVSEKFSIPRVRRDYFYSCEITICYLFELEKHPPPPTIPIQKLWKRVSSFFDVLIIYRLFPGLSHFCEKFHRWPPSRERMRTVFKLMTYAHIYTTLHMGRTNQVFNYWVFPLLFELFICFCSPLPRQLWL